jgi:predicted nucleotidyltransferase
MAVTPVQTAVPIPYAAVAAFCQRHHIQRLWLFGSVLRPDFSAGSDVDVLVEFDPAHIPGWEIVSMQDELAELLGRPVDLGTPQSLSERIRQQVMQTARVIYERAQPVPQQDENSRANAV